MLIAMRPRNKRLLWLVQQKLSVKLACAVWIFPGKINCNRWTETYFGNKTTQYRKIIISTFLPKQTREFVQISHQKRLWEYYFSLPCCTVIERFLVLFIMRPATQKSVMVKNQRPVPNQVLAWSPKLCSPRISMHSKVTPIVYTQ